MHWLKAVYCIVPKHGDSQKNNKRWVEATEMDALRRSSRISRKERIRNVTIRQQIGLEGTINGHVQRMAEGRLPKIALKWMPKQKRARGRPNKNWVESIRKAMNERNLTEGQWDDKKQWSLGVGQGRKTFWNRCTQKKAQVHNNIIFFEKYFRPVFQQPTVRLTSWLLISGHAVYVKLFMDICSCPVTSVFWTLIPKINTITTGKVQAPVYVTNISLLESLSTLF